MRGCGPCDPSPILGFHPFINMVKTETVKGFRDFLGDEARKRVKIKRIIEDEFNSFGFEPAETPIVEFENFVSGGNSNDEAVRDVYRLKDRAKRDLALRYEFTFQLKRIAKGQKLPYKRYQIGYNFRDEPIKKGRLRQFIQCDCDIVGAGPKDEAEIMAVAKNILNNLNIDSVIYFNNRKLLNQILVSENIEERNREQVIRELDKLDKLTKAEVAFNLKPLGAEKLLDKFDKGEEYFEKFKFYEEVRELKNICKNYYGFDIEFNPTLARGLSYYNGTVFELWSKDINVSIGGGGSYLIGDVQACGVAFGLEPIFLISDVNGDSTDYMIISIGQDKESVRLAKKLRENENSVQLMLDKTIKKAMEYANSKGVGKVVFVGDEEVKSGRFKVKDMVSGNETDLGI